MTYRQLLQCELAKRDFWAYCKLMAPDFYFEGRDFLKKKCQEYQAFWDGPEEYLIDNEPPRHGKSRTASLFVQWVIGRCPSDKVVTASYNETLSTVFSKAVRNKIQEHSGDGQIVYSDIFPGIEIRRGDGAANLWGIEGKETYSYLATSPTGTVTGFGADLILIDDVIKNAYEAKNDNIKEQLWRWFTDTMLSRREGKRKVIIIMTRWATDDLAGRLMEKLDAEKTVYRKIVYKAYDGKQMLCSDILDYEQYQSILSSDMGRDIVEANYNQNPIDLTGRLYEHFATYDKLPENITDIAAYTDTADTGDDWLCAIIYAVSDYKAYVLDVLYTKEPMEITEDLLAHKLSVWRVNRSKIEANNGGRGFSRNVMRITREKYSNNSTGFQTFTQHKNKNARILTNSTGVMNNVLFPEDWAKRWPEYYRDMTRYQRTGKNAHDDAPDATTGVVENLPSKPVKGSYHSLWHTGL